jgi:hypothetical protein
MQGNGSLPSHYGLLIISIAAQHAAAQTRFINSAEEWSINIRTSS